MNEIKLTIRVESNSHFYVAQAFTPGTANTKNLIAPSGAKAKE
jgi:hypothetical protein